MRLFQLVVTLSSLSLVLACASTPINEETPLSSVDPPAAAAPDSTELVIITTPSDALNQVITVMQGQSLLYEGEASIGEVSLNKSTGTLTFYQTADLSEHCPLPKPTVDASSWISSCWSHAQKALPALSDTASPVCSCAAGDSNPMLLIEHRINLLNEDKSSTQTGKAVCDCSKP